MAEPALYGGDEVSAVVIDTGSYFTRFGFAGEDAPKLTVSTKYAIKENPNYDPEQIEDAPPTEDVPLRAPSVNHKDKSLYYFDNDATVPRPGAEIVSPLEDGVVRDWDSITPLWDFGLHKGLAIDPTEHPLLLTEQIWNSDENRTKAMAYAFETLEAPAFYVAKSPACSMFASGKGSGLIVDVGHNIVTATPVIDGMVLYKPAKRSRYGGQYLNQQISQALTTAGITVTPRYLIKSKERVALGEPASFATKTLENIHPSYHNLQVDSVLTEFKETILQTLPAPDSDLSSSTARTFEFPDGSSRSYTNERYQLTETLFNPRDSPLDGERLLEKDAAAAEPEEKDETKALLYTDSSTSPFTSTGVSDLIVNSINACDVDIRANLANNIVITGGTSLIQGFTDRVNQDLTRALAGLKIRIYAPGNTTERRNSAWVGGSILASLGTFHQLWISKKEYEEVGAKKLLEKRFR